MDSRTQTAIATIVTVLLLMVVSTGSTYFIFWKACSATTPEPIGQAPMSLSASTEPVPENPGDVVDQKP